ncbi:cytochrome P450 [Actinomadura rupiterrae]|uniref:cytochrome P450 n=1 Tax=Actinomadura rupiterrae TaxID=559627 RepID=UPI0020A607AC|nr:cytochrome P450 [Actinomadura rupiterrae]MCP2337053.1 cytochrome P450 [Actinomadura rupiterrae]
MISERFPDDGSYEHGHPFELYARIRERGPVRHPALPLWIVGTHAHVHRIASDPVAFRSGDGILIPEIGHSYDAPPTLLHTDPPEHTRYRGLVAPAFRPALTRTLSGAVRDRVRTLLDALPPAFDAVGALAVPLPLQVICLLLGIPESDWPRFHRWTDAIIPGVSGLPEDERNALRAECGLYLLETAHRRRLDPRDDVISGLALAELDGDRLTDLELVMFLIQLLVAGNETTRHAVSGGLLALATHPSQWTALRDRPGLLPSAVEEILRWTSPVSYFLRTATRDVPLGDAVVGAGEHVMLLFGSANHDQAAFGASAGRFDITREPSAPGLAFGHGPHFCLGAALARMEIRILLEEAALRHPRLTLTGTPVWNGSPIVTGLTRLPLDATARR